MRKFQLGAIGLAIVAILSFFAISHSRADTEVFREREVWNAAATTGTNILATDLTPLTRGTISTAKASSCTYRLCVAYDSGASDAILYLRVTRVGSTTANFALNGGVALTKGCAYTFAFNATSGFTYNLRIDTNTTIGLLAVDRIDTGTN